MPLPSAPDIWFTTYAEKFSGLSDRHGMKDEARMDRKDAYIRNDTPRIIPVPAHFPPHGPSQLLLLDVPHLRQRHVDRVICNQHLRLVIVTIRRVRFVVKVLFRTREWQVLEVVDTCFPRPFADALVGLAQPCRVSERAAVQRHPEVNLRTGHASGNVGVDHRIGGIRG